MFIFLVIGIALLVLWVLCYLKGVKSKKYQQFMLQLTNDMFIMKELYFIGYAALDMMHNDCRNGMWAKKMKNIEELFGKKYAGFYNYSLWAGKLTLMLTITPLMVLVGVMANEMIFCVLGIVMGPAIGLSLDNSVFNRVTERRENILIDFPQIVSKIAMLINAGMTLGDAWRQVAFSRDSLVYKEMQRTSLEIQKEGAHMEEAYYEFGDRCNLPEIRKFAALVVQNLKLGGGTETAIAFQNMADERWQQKKNIVLRKGEVAGNKLLLPIMLMFVGVLLMIMVPAFMSMGNL